MARDDSCLDENLVVAFLEERLGAAAATRVEAHAADCEPCRRLIAHVADALPPIPTPTEVATGTPRAAGGRLARGEAVGRYVVSHLLGAGGMGVVYAATDPELNRQVAVKLLARGVLDQPQAQLRLVREAQALAKLSHPNVVTVHDTGTWQGQVFVAMELVDGETVRGWLRERRSWRDTVAVYVAAGRGLAAAHRAGIVHRDFKPDNVLLSTDGRVRVADFGLAGDAAQHAPVGGATALDRSGAADTLRFSAETAGTPAYMSPEHHLRQAVDARSDQFAFCVALYEGLYGVRPFDGHTLGELRDSVLGRAFAPPTRDTAVPSWVRAIVLRGLRHDPAERFPSMDALVAALETDPVLLRRRRLAGGALVAVSGLALWAWLRPAPAAAPACDSGATRMAGVWDRDVRLRVHLALLATGRPYAEDTYARVGQALDGYVGDWSTMYREACEATAVHHTQSEALLDRRMLCLDHRLSGLRALTTILQGPIDPALLSRAIGAAQQLDSIAACADVEALTAALEPPVGAEARARVAELRDHLTAAKVLDTTGHIRSSRAVVEAALVEARAVDDPPALAEALYLAADAEQRTGDYAAAERNAKEGLEVAARAHAVGVETRLAGLALLVVGWREGRVEEALAFAPFARAAAAAAGQDFAAQSLVYVHLANLLLRHGDLEEGRSNAARALELAEKGAGPDGYDTALAHNQLGLGLMDLERYDEALPELRASRAIFERVLGPDHPNIAGTTANICGLLHEVGRYPEALVECQRACAIFTRSVGPDSPELALALMNTGDVLLEMQRPLEAMDPLRRALAIKERKLGPDHPETETSVFEVATALGTLGRHEEALALLRRALAGFEAKLGPASEESVFARAGIAGELAALERIADAGAEVARAVAIAEKLGAERRTMGAVLGRAAAIALAAGRAAEADADAQRAIEILQRTLGAEHPDLAGPRITRGAALLALGRKADARHELERVLALPAPWLSPDDQLSLARSLWAAGGDRQRAVALAHAAAAELHARGSANRAAEATAQAWLERHE
jgi:tetratricopeptide (TPR) repeat protein